MRRPFVCSPELRPGARCEALLMSGAQCPCRGMPHRSGFVVCWTHQMVLDRTTRPLRFVRAGGSLLGFFMAPGVAHA